MAALRTTPDLLLRRGKEKSELVGKAAAEGVGAEEGCRRLYSRYSSATFSMALLVLTFSKGQYALRAVQSATGRW